MIINKHKILRIKIFIDKHIISENMMYRIHFQITGTCYFNVICKCQTFTNVSYLDTKRKIVMAATRGNNYCRHKIHYAEDVEPFSFGVLQLSLACTFGTHLPDSPEDN